jgi:hypothetical protein
MGATVPHEAFNIILMTLDKDCHMLCDKVAHNELALLFLAPYDVSWTWIRCSKCLTIYD